MPQDREMTKIPNFWVIENWNLPFDWAQGGEPVEPFAIWCLALVIMYFGDGDEPRAKYI